MIKAEINFNSNTKRTKLELIRVIQIRLSNGDVVFKCYADDGPRTWRFDYGDIDYIRLGNQ